MMDMVSGAEVRNEKDLTYGVEIDDGVITADFLARLPSSAELQIPWKMMAAAQEIVECPEHGDIEKTQIDLLVRFVVYLERRRSLQAERQALSIAAM